MFTESFVATVLTVVLVACILACARRKHKKCELDKETPLPSIGLGTQSSLDPTVNNKSAINNVYDDANENTVERVKHAPSATSMEGNYEDVEKASRPPLPGGGGGGMIPRRSTHDMNVVKRAPLPELQSTSRHTISRLDSVPPRTLSQQDSKGLPFDAPVEDDEPPPALPPKTDAAEILYDVGAGGGSAAGCAGATSSTSQHSTRPVPTPKLGSPSPQLPHHQQQQAQKSMTTESSGWMNNQGKLDEDDGPPPALPPKTAEAELIYGENIPLNSIRPPQPTYTACSPDQAAAKNNTERHAKLATANSLPVKSRVAYDEDERAPSLPPRTAGAEELYDYGRSNAMGALKPTMDDTSGMAYTEVTFGSETPQPNRAMQGMSYTEVAFNGVDASLRQPQGMSYAEVSFGGQDNPAHRPPQGMDYTEVSFGGGPEFPKSRPPPLQASAAGAGGMYADVTFQ